MKALRAVGLAAVAGAATIALVFALQEPTPGESPGDRSDDAHTGGSTPSSTLRGTETPPGPSDSTPPGAAGDSPGSLESVLESLEAEWPVDSQQYAASLWGKLRVAQLPGGAEALADWFFAGADRLSDRRNMLVATLLNSALETRGSLAPRQELARHIRQAWESMDPVTPAKWRIGYRVIRYSITAEDQLGLERIEANAWRLAGSSPQDASRFLADAASLGCDSNRLFDEVVRLTELGLQREMETGNLADDVEELLDKADILLERRASNVPVQLVERLFSSSSDGARFVAVRVLIHANPGRPDMVANRIIRLSASLEHHLRIAAVRMFIRQYKEASTEYLPALLHIPDLEPTAGLADVLSEGALALRAAKLADLLAEGKAGWDGDAGKIVLYE